MMTIGSITQLTTDKGPLPKQIAAVPFVRSDPLLAALRSARHPNCTLYLIWHYLDRGDVNAAQAEYARDSDKLGTHRKTVEEVLANAAPKQQALPPVRSEPLLAAYDRFSHLDRVFEMVGDSDGTENTDPFHPAARDMWRAIKASLGISTTEAHGRRSRTVQPLVGGSDSEVDHV
jgi:hypothetical protein